MSNVCQLLLFPLLPYAETLCQVISWLIGHNLQQQRSKPMLLVRRIL